MWPNLNSVLVRGQQGILTITSNSYLTGSCRIERNFLAVNSREIEKESRALFLWILIVFSLWQSSGKRGGQYMIYLTTNTPAPGPGTDKEKTCVGLFGYSPWNLVVIIPGLRNSLSLTKDGQKGTRLKLEKIGPTIKFCFPVWKISKCQNSFCSHHYWNIFVYRSGCIFPKFSRQ